MATAHDEFKKDDNDDERKPIITTGGNDGIPKVAVDAARQLNMSATRATFLAGFAYYQIGRFRYSPTVSYADSSDTMYIVFVTVSFQASLLCAILGFSFNYYLSSLKKGSEKKAFCENNRVLIRYVYQLLIWSAVSYLLGLGRIGFVYYPGGYMKYFPFGMMILFAILMYTGWYMVPRIAAQLHTIGRDEEEVSAHQEFADSVINDSKYGKFKREGHDDPYESTLLKHCSTISGRAIFIAGLGQQAMMRFMPNAGLDYGMGAWTPNSTIYENPSPIPGGTPHFAYDDIAANSFLFFATLATGLAFVSGFTLSTVEIFVADAPEQKQLAFAILVTPLARACYFAYGTSLVLISITIVLMGYGTNSPSWACLSLGLISALTMLGGFLYSNHWANKIQANEAEEAANTKDRKMVFDNLLETTHNAGGMATYAVGYVYYNVLTMNSDVMYMQPNSALFQGYIFVNALTVILGLNAIIFDSFIAILVNDITCSVKRLLFMQHVSWITALVDAGYKISLVGWLVVFAFFGQIKLWDQSVKPAQYYAVTTWTPYITMISSILAGLITLVASLHMTCVYNEVFNGSYPDELNVPEGVDLTVTRELKRQGSMNALAAGVLFLGGFAFFATDFFKKVADWQTAAMIDFYLTTLSLCFSASICVLYWSSSYNTHMSQLPTDAHRFVFSRRTQFIYYLTLVAGGVTVSSILLAVLFLGVMKNNEYNPENAYYLVENCVWPMASLSFVIILAKICYMVPIFCSTRQAELANSFDSEETEDYRQYEAELDQSTTTSGFVAGNVCYELLFSDALAPDIWINYYYFGLTALAFGLAVAACSVSVLMRVGIGGLDTENGRKTFVRKASNVEALVFYLSNTSIFSWMIACLALGYTKYQAPKPQLWEPSFFITCLTVLAVLFIYPMLKLSAHQVCANE